MSKLDLTLPVVETFTSIQGESTHAGRLCFFIRLAGCNLKCSYCDTVYGQDAASGTLQTLGTLLEAAEASGVDLVEITGGEPALHPATPELAAALLKNGFEVLMETNGSILLDKFPHGVKRIIDVKLPSSNMSEYNDPSNYELLHEGDELKFVTGSFQDFQWPLAAGQKECAADLQRGLWRCKARRNGRVDAGKPPLQHAFSAADAQIHLAA